MNQCHITLIEQMIKIVWSFSAGKTFDKIQDAIMKKISEKFGREGMQLNIKKGL